MGLLWWGAMLWMVHRYPWLSHVVFFCVFFTLSTLYGRSSAVPVFVFVVFPQVRSGLWVCSGGGLWSSRDVLGHPHVSQV